MQDPITLIRLTSRKEDRLEPQSPTGPKTLETQRATRTGLRFADGVLRLPDWRLGRFGAACHPLASGRVGVHSRVNRFVWTQRDPCRQHNANLTA